MDKAQIIQRIEEIEEHVEFFDRAIEAKICPECGSLLDRYIGGWCGAVANYAITYMCRSCGFEYKTRGCYIEGDIQEEETEEKKTTGLWGILAVIAICVALGIGGGIVIFY